MAEHDDTPLSGRRDDLHVERIGPAFRFAASDESLRAALIDAINAMGGTGDDAEDRYQRTVDVLRERASDTVRAMADEYASLDEFHRKLARVLGLFRMIVLDIWDVPHGIKNEVALC